MNNKKKAAETKMGKPTLLPKRRFPEFRNAPEWEETPLEKIFAERIEKGHPEKAVLSATQDRGVIPYELLDKSVIRDRKNLAGYKLVRKEDFVISLRSFEGGFEYSDYEGIISPAYVILEKKLEVNNTFFQVLFKSSTFIKKIHKLLNNSLRDGKSISYNQAKGLTLTTPLSDEQEKIADCLSSVDELITAEAQKVETLKAHKKGLMQLLFPAEGETLPKLRFPEFRNAPEWEQSKLNNFIEEFRERSTVQNQHEVLTSSRAGLVRQSEYYENSRLTKRDNIGFNVLPPNYITYRSRSDDGLFFFNENELGITGIVSVYYPVFRMVGGYNKFFISLLSLYAEIIGRKSVGNAQKVLSMNVLKEIVLPVPSPKEQMKIASCLSSLDEFIAAQAQKVEALKAHKKGLMQQLFPVPQAEE